MMVYKHCTVKYSSNYTEEDGTKVFFQKEKDLQKRCMKFVNQKNWDPTSSRYITV